jgi:hypothetical protein
MVAQILWHILAYRKSPHRHQLVGATTKNQDSQNKIFWWRMSFMLGCSQLLLGKCRGWAYPCGLRVRVRMGTDGYGCGYGFPYSGLLKRAQEQPKQVRNEWDIAKFVEFHKFGYILSISHSFWLFLGLFWWVNLCGLRVRVPRGRVWVSAVIPKGYPCISLVIILYNVPS